MNTTEFEAFTRTASRRSSLLALGGAGLASTWTGVFGAAAKPKAGKLARKKVKAKCQAQVGQCEAAFTRVCEASADPEDCTRIVQTLLPCCEAAGTCNAGAMLECVLTGGVQP